MSKALAADELSCRDESIKTSFDNQYMKLRKRNTLVHQNGGHHSRSKLTSQKSLHTLSLQKLRLAKPLAEAKKELDKALYAVVKNPV